MAGCMGQDARGGIKNEDLRIIYWDYGNKE